MTTVFPRFIQIHSLHNYAAALLNRDDSGLAKRLPYGNAVRTRVSSQCLKRHWRMHEGPLSLRGLVEDGLPHSLRSRELVTREMRAPLNESFATPKEQNILNGVEDAFQKAVYGEKGMDKRDKDGAVAAKDKGSRQPLLFGVPEVNYLAKEFARVAEEARAEGIDDDKKALKFAESALKDIKKNLETLRENTRAPGGLAAALFGRMVTSDTAANIEAPVYVAHAFTTHEAEDESDYFTVVDDLTTEDPGAGHIGETELTSGLFYGYVVIDVAGLVANLTGKKPAKQGELTEEDRALAGEVVRRLIHAIAEVSPGAKLGSTAPFGYASTMLVEAGDRQPRSLADAFRTASVPELEAAENAMSQTLAQFEQNYATGETRRFMALNSNTQFEGAERTSLPDLAKWASKLVVSGNGQA